MRTSDKAKIEKILKSLRKHPEGTYLSEIARETKLAKSTVSYLLTKHFSKKTVLVKKSKAFKLFKLKTKTSIYAVSLPLAIYKN